MATRSCSRLVRHAAVLLVGILGCERAPTAPFLDFRLVSLNDGSNGGASYFRFLPPVGRQVTFSGVFDAAASPVVRICEVAGSGCGIEVATMTMSPASGDEIITVDAGDQRYETNWHSWRVPNFSSSKTRTYRIRVYVGADLLGYADIWVGPSLPTIPIKFRLETHAPPPPPAPVASFAPTCSNLACSFDGSGSTAQSSATYSWSWGDGTAAGSGSSATHTYAAAGTYPVILAVTDAGGMDADTQMVIASPPPPPAPVASFSPSCANLACSFDGSASSAQPSATYGWT